MARLVVAMLGLPHESRGASRVLFYRYIERLRREGHALLLLTFLDSAAWSEDELRELGERLGIETFACRTGSLVEEGRFRHRLDEAATAPAIAPVRAFAPDAIVCFDFVAAWAMRACPGIPRLVWLGDLNFETKWWHAVYATAENWRNALHLPGNLLGCRAWRRIYGEVLRDADDVIVASHSSIAALAPLGVKAAYEPYPWPEPDDVAARRLAPQPTFVFFGSLAGLGSRSGLHFLLEDVFPRLRRHWGAGGFRLLLAGSGELPDWAKTALAGRSEIVALGFVEDLGALLATCHAALFPISVPIGNRSRILTAMTYRVPVVAHRNCALGNIDLVDGDTAFLAGDGAGFSQRLRRVVEDPGLAESVADRAYVCYKTRFHPDAAGGRLAKRVEQLLAR
jgi:glycosyltransferase involved in cell wall biosynthesis